MASGHPGDPARNLGFEEATGEDPLPGWDASNLARYDFVAGTTGDRPAEGRRVLRLRRVAEEHPGEWTGRVQQWIDAAPFRGKRVRASAAARVASAGQGARAFLELRALGRPLDQAGPSADVACEGPGEGWHRHAVELDVPVNAAFLRVTLAMVGDGSVDFDAVEVGEAR